MDPNFDSTQSLRRWLRGPEVWKATQSETFPTRETHRLWLEYMQSFVRTASGKWSAEREICDVVWTDHAPANGTPLRLIEDEEEDGTIVTDAEFRPLGIIDRTLNFERCGLLRATVLGGGKVVLRYFGLDDLWSER